ncbi:MAG: FAD:protein FMN transferase [Thiotrichales bacterium]|nr:MAG: FAD:protein FMN transferase [Thiotrichales bacterium]
MRPGPRNKPLAVFCLLLLTGCCLLTACASRTGEHKHTIFVFGTLIDITLYNVTETEADSTFEYLERTFHAWHASWTPWEESDLSRINESIQSGTSAPVPGNLLPMIRVSKTLYERSDGLFNPAIGNLINLWQMHRHDEPDIKPPDAAAVARVLEQDPKMSDIEIDGSVLRSNNPAVQLSLGAFAKGYAIDLAMAYVRSRNINDAVINAGGDLRVIGQHGERRWRIGIRHPREDGVIAWLEAESGESVFSSGDYERFFMHNGQRYHHILDPRTGYPAQKTASVTVIHDDAGVADAAATALFVAGPDRWHEIARSMGVKYVMLIDSSGRIHMNPAMKKRINLINSQTSHIVLSQPL